MGTKRGQIYLETQISLSPELLIEHPIEICSSIILLCSTVDGRTLTI